jgi:hypothetical protein
MNIRKLAMIAAATLVLTPGISLAHDVPNMSHTHAFKQTGYGKYRQGHYVNGPQGSIIIWSPQTYTEYQSGPAVRFARPRPITRAPGSPAVIKKSEADPAVDYGKR